MRILLHIRHYGWVGARAQRAGTLACAIRIHSSEIARRQGLNTVLAAYVADDAIAQIVTGHSLCDLGGFSSTLSFIVKEEEKPVLDDGATKGSAEGVADQLSGDI